MINEFTSVKILSWQLYKLRNAVVVEQEISYMQYQAIIAILQVGGLFWLLVMYLVSIMCLILGFSKTSQVNWQLEVTAYTGYVVWVVVFSWSGRVHSDFMK